ncbi:putative T7SS-secreted protein [Streptomyces ovatisporus]|uniref:T7SS-secreted protein n=1 Tax=Streptomyces ovatisporus TaxID=1128682 RepID=A0ABV9A591_9ACTN
MAANPYPNLGWNPVPGIPTEVHSLKTKVDKAAKALRSSYQQIERLLGESSHWEGDAADAFRDELDGDLPKYMKNAAASLEKAAAQLTKWDGDLTSNRELAKKYDDEAKEAKAAQGTAKTQQDEAGKDPDLKLGGKEYPSQAEADAATARLRAAEGRLKSASASLEKANKAYESVISKAKELEKEHEREANTVADALDEAEDDLAPKEPGWLSKTLSAIGDGLKAAGKFLLDHAGTIGAIAGLLALFPTPLAPVFAGIAVVASAANMAKNLASEDFRDSLTGKYGGMEAFSAWASMGGDALGMIPGAGALGKAGGEVSMLAGAAREGGDVMSATSKVAAFGRETVSAFNFKALDVATDPNTGLLQYGINGANVLANSASSLETAGVIPDAGPAHDGAEFTKAGAAAYGLPGGAADFADGMGDLVAGLRL